MKLFRILDPFTLTPVVTVLLASFFPARGGFVPFFEGLTTAAIALLFFMHGAKLSAKPLSREATGDSTCGSCAAPLFFSQYSACCLRGGLRSMLTRRSIPVSSTSVFCQPPSVRDCLYFAGRRQRRGRCLLGIGIKPVRDFRLAAAGWPTDEYAVQAVIWSRSGKICLQLLLPFCPWSSFSSVDGGVCGEAQEMDLKNRPDVDPAGGLLRLQRSRGEWYLA